QYLRGALRQCARRAVGERRARLVQLERRLDAQHPRHRLATLHHLLDEQRRGLRQVALRVLEQRRSALGSAGRALHAVSPLATLERGYAILFDADRRVVRSAASVATDAEVLARLADGTMKLRR